MLFVALFGGSLRAADIPVRDPAEFRRAVAAAKPGDRLLLATGNYSGGFHFAQLAGTAEQPIVIASADPQKPAVFRDANTGLHLSSPAYVELADLEFVGLRANGLNIDDGGGAQPRAAHHVTLRRLKVRDVGQSGNEDGIKLSGLDDFRVEDCTIERWGTGGGSAIDMVGCHRGAIAHNTIRHVDPAPGNCTGVQMKGGTSDVVVRQNRFENAGGRAVNLGGSTGQPFFRPPLAPAGEHAEARNLRVEGNTFIGGVTPVAFVGVDGAVVRFNTIEQPGRWALRILQENRAAGFIACRNGVFEDNVIAFTSTRWGEGGVNLGAGTAPETFRFARNWWYCTDRPDRSEPRLPTREADGVYGRPLSEANGKAGASAWRP